MATNRLFGVPARGVGVGTSNVGSHIGSGALSRIITLEGVS
jgi:hypothetical protein